MVIMSEVKTEFKPSFYNLCLQELNEKQKHLIDDLNASIALQAFLPDVFEKGSVKVKVRSKRDQFTININGKDYDSKELPDVYWKHLKSKLVRKSS